MIDVALIPGCQVYKVMNKHFPLLFPLEDEHALTEMGWSGSSLRSVGLMGLLGAVWVSWMG